MNNPFEIADQIANLRKIIEEYYFQPVINSEGDIISYQDWEEENKD